MARRLARRTTPEPEEPEEPAEDEEVEPEWHPTPLLYNVPDSCFILGKISKQMLYRQIHEKRIHPVKIGTRSLFTMPELERFVAECERETADAQIAS